MISFKLNDVPKACPPNQGISIWIGEHRYPVQNSKHSLCPLSCWVTSHQPEWGTRCRESLTSPAEYVMLRLRKTPRDSQFQLAVAPTLSPAIGRHSMCPEWIRLLISEKEASRHLLRNQPEAPRLTYQPLPAFRAFFVLTKSSLSGEDVEETLPALKIIEGT